LRGKRNRKALGRGWGWIEEGCGVRKRDCDERRCGEEKDLWGGDDVIKKN